jgi:hypothetical protein
MENILAPLSVCVLIGFIAWIVFTSIRRVVMARLQATLQAKLLERINSPETLLTYVSTDAGREFVEALRLERELEPRTTPFRSILVGVQLSIVLIVFGGALLLLHANHTLPDDGAVVMGTLAVALGIGLGIAAAAGRSPRHESPEAQGARAAMACLRRRHEPPGDRHRYRPHRSQHPSAFISSAQKGRKPSAAGREDVMTQDHCEHEPLVAAAIRSGSWPADLEHHVAACECCTETKRVAQFFFEHAATTSAQSHLPAANIVWQKMHALRQQRALIRATRCMTLMRILAALYAVALGVWYLPYLWQKQPASFSTTLNAFSGGMVFTGVVTAVVAVVLGSCCLVLLGSRATSRLRT